MQSDHLDRVDEREPEDLHANIMQGFEAAKAALEAKGLQVSFVYIPSNPPLWPHDNLHMEAFKEYAVSDDGSIHKARETVYLTRLVVASELGAYALAGWILEEWLDLFENFTMERGSL